MFCKFCGKKLEEGATSCMYCGKSLAENAPNSAKPQKSAYMPMQVVYEIPDSDPSPEEPKKENHKKAGKSKQEKKKAGKSNQEKPKKPEKQEQAEKPKLTGKRIGVFLVTGLVVGILLGVLVFEMLNRADETSIVGTWVATKVEYQGKTISLDKYLELTGEDVELSFNFNAEGYVTATGLQSGRGAYAEESGVVNITINGDTHTLAHEDETLAFQAQGVWMVLEKGEGRSNISVDANATPDPKPTGAARSQSAARAAPTEDAVTTSMEVSFPAVLDYIMKLAGDKSVVGLAAYGMDYNEEMFSEFDVSRGLDGFFRYEISREFDGYPWYIGAGKRPQEEKAYSAFAQYSLDYRRDYYYETAQERAARAFSALCELLVERYGGASRFAIYRDGSSVSLSSVEAAVEAIASGSDHTISGFWVFKNGGKGVNLGLGVHVLRTGSGRVILEIHVGPY